MNSITSKRDSSVQFLLKEQECGFNFCWKVRQGFKKEVDPERIRNYSHWFFINNLLPHFSVEEDFIFPLLQFDSPFIKRAKMDHCRLKRLFRDNSDIQKSLSLIEEELENYFRFERFKLTNEIRNNIPHKKLLLIRKMYSESISFEDWGDKFWK